MKNFILILCFSIPIWMMGQSIKIFHSSSTSELNNGQITILGSYNDGEIPIHLKVKNTGGGNLNVLAKKRIVSTIIGTENTFCWAGECYPGYVSTNAASIIPNSTDSSFGAYYKPNGHSSITEVAYTFYADHGTDSATVNVTYDATSAAVEDNIVNTNFISAPYPNPANAFTTFNYSLKSSNNSYLTIHNILGDEIRRNEITSKNGTVKVYTSNLTSGFYFCSFYSEGKVVKTQKFTITR